MGWVNYKSARIFMIISSIILGLFGIALIIIDLLFALNETYGLANSLHSYYVVMSVGCGGGGVWIIWCLIGIILGWIKKKTDWLKWLMVIFILFICIWWGGICYYIYWFNLFILNPYGLCTFGMPE